ncbi:glycosyltransferase [Sphingomonas sp.]|uniref:glycosyltransferase n=1 Tax=Sphingomonas sp. TaxID=28214 RepID=UPI0025D61F78|nr:glycosyltransferase [Sphingomonas sp.]MBV9527815.1 glycosyltransferase [Sphingomonas sp.]
MPPDPASRVRPQVSLVLHKFSRGGSDRVAAYLANGFRDAGMDVELTVLCRGGEVEGHLVELVDDIPIVYLGRASGSRAWDLVRTFPALVRHLRRLRPDAIVSTANNTALATAFALKAAGLTSRLLLKTTNPIASSRHKGVAKALRRWSYSLIFGWTDQVWTLSADESEEMRQAFPRFAPIFRDVQNPYVTPAMLASVKAAPRAAGNTVVTIARLTSQKRLDRLIAAFARVRTPQARLLILGEGEDRAALERQVADLGLADRVSMPGYVPDVAAALHQADLFVLTSEYEGLPAAVLEAMAADCPVLCTDCFPAARTLLVPADGCAIIEDVSPEPLARQMGSALTRPRPTGLRAIAERYSIANGVRSHVEALREALDRA